MATEPFIGEIKTFAFDFAPKFWAQCNGQLLPINQNQALFSLLGTTYGGNGSTNFALPDLRGRIALSFGTGPGLPAYQQGQSAGVTNVTLPEANLPSHTHAVQAAATQPATSGGGNADSPPGNVPANSGELNYAPANSANATSAAAVPSATTQPEGGSQPVSIMPPYLTLNVCIALSGIFPSRN